MKNTHFVLLFLVFSVYLNPLSSSSVSFQLPYEDSRIGFGVHSNYTSPFVDKTGALTPTFLKLLEITNVPKPYTLESLVPSIKKIWMRGDSVEYYQIKELAHLKSKASEIQNLCNQLGCVNEETPKLSSYNYGIVLGATASAMRKRFAYLNNQIKKGLKLEKIVVLVGQRPRFDIETKKVLVEESHQDLPFKKGWKWDSKKVLPATETDIAKLIYEQSDFCKEFLNIPITFVDAPLLKKDDGTTTRPTTESTILKFLETKPEPGTCLCISNQPYCLYQNVVVSLNLPPTFSVETIGPKANESAKVADYLDTIGRAFVYEQKLIYGL